MNKPQKRGILLIIGGLVLVLAALAIHLVQRQDDIMAGQTSQMLLEQLELNRPVIPMEVTPNEAPREQQTSTVMPEKSYMGYSMIGSVRIPSVDVHLPILSSGSEELLKVAPCRYWGSIPGSGMIVMGHNYNSQFTPLHRVGVGDEVVFENVEGRQYRMVVDQLETLKRSEGEKLVADYPLTLVTCTPGGLERLVVRCRWAE